MLNRNATRHLLFVVSILLCFFLYMGYRLFGKGGAAPATTETAANEFASYSGPADSSPLRPQGSSASGLKPPPSSSGDMGDWIPSARGDDLALMPEPASPVPAPPGGGSFFDSAPSSSPSGPITGLIPAPPSGAAPSSPIRPPMDSLPPQLTPPGGMSMPMDALEEASSFAASASGLKPPESVAAPGGSSLPVPPFGGTDSPMEMGGGMASPPVAPPVRPATGAPSYAPPAPGGYDAPEESAPPVATSTRPPAPPPSTRPAPPAATTRPAPPQPSAPAPTTRPVSSAQTGYDEYGEDYDDEDEDDMSSGSESLRLYVVRPGDTLSNIAARELGSISLADNIFLLNRDVIEDPDQLNVGVKIRLPVRMGYGVDNGRAPGGDRRPTLGTGRTHTVARGDTLSSIAQQYYGSSATWRFLYEANKNIVPNPNQLSVGTELTIPPYEEN